MGAGEPGGMFPQNILKFQSSRTKERVFHSEYVAFIKPLNYRSQSIPTRNEQVMKTKLHTVAC